MSMVEVTIKCGACGFIGKGLQDEDEDLDDDEVDECPMCGEPCKEEDDISNDKNIDDEDSDKGKVIPFSLYGEDDDKDEE